VTAAIALLPVADAHALPTLHHGDRGRSVAKLQRALHLGDDGVFGRGTLHAVKRFQRRHGLTADGVVGAGTWRMIRRSLHRHASGRAACSRRASAWPPTGSSARARRGRCAASSALTA
jgi:murein L,D-transpeptidase YcbB/YkuD